MRHRMPENRRCCMARQRFDAKDIAGARTQLEWAMKNASRNCGSAQRAFAAGATCFSIRARPASALALVNIKDTNGFISEYEEIRGDVLLAQGDREGARRAYQEAIEKLPRVPRHTCRYLTMKRDNLGPEKAP